MEDYLKKWKVSMDAIRQAKETGLARQAECSIAKGSQVVDAIRPREAKKLTKETKRQMKMQFDYPRPSNLNYKKELKQVKAMKKAGEFLNPRQQEMLDKTAQGEEAYRQNKKAEEQALKEDCARAK